MWRKMVAVVLVGGWTAYAQADADAWTLTKPSGWSREAQAIAVTRQGAGVFEIRHTGSLDWAVSGLPRIPVVPGQQFAFSCASDAVAGSDAGQSYTLSVILRDAANNVLAWTYASRAAKPGEPIACAFMVPPGGASIEPRLVGTGPCAVSVRDVRLVRQTAVAIDPSHDVALETPALKVVVAGTNAFLTVTDRRTGRVWTPTGVRGGCFVSRLERKGETVSARLIDPQTLRSFDIVVAPERDRPEVLVTVQGSGELVSPLDYPAPFATRKGDRLIVPMNEGISFPADDAADLPGRLITYGGHGLCMSFFGVQEDATGAGYLAIVETPDDAAMVVHRDDPTHLASLGISWEDQKKAFGPARKIRFIFQDKGGYVAMCKRYRAYAKEIGLFKSFAEKAKARPNIDKLLGAPNIWCWEKDKLAVAKNLKEAGIDRFLWSGGGSPEQVKALAAMDNVLVSRYDVYQDIYHPDQLEKLGWKSGSNTDAWPHDIVWNSEKADDWRHAWGVQAKDGTWTWCAMMCDKVAPNYERRNVKKELETHPYNTRFIDTTVASPWQTCWNPAHPMTRTDSKQAKMELLRILGDEFGLVVGSETGHDASVPYCDYYEGMLSLGPYRVPDSGRNLHEIWTNVPPRVAKYQLGEKYRLPLWELVYHECVCAHWYWGDYNNKLPTTWAKRDLFNVLYGTMGMYMFNNRQWNEDRDKFVRSYRITSPVARATGYSEMLDHRILTPDRTVQQTRFANGTVVTVNFKDGTYSIQ